MNAEEQIVQILETSHHAAQRTRTGWRHRTTRVANGIATAIVLLAAGLSLAFVPVAGDIFYRSSQSGGSLEADCQTIYQMVEQL